jgi:hypothetical protein
MSTLKVTQQSSAAKHLLLKLMSLYELQVLHQEVKSTFVKATTAR